MKEGRPSEHRVRRWILAGAFAALLAAGVAAIFRMRVSEFPGSSTVPEVTGIAGGPSGPGESPPAAEGAVSGLAPIRTASGPASRTSKATVRVHGVVIARSGAPAPAGTRVRLLTMRPEVDSPDAAEALEDDGSIRGTFVDGAWRSYGEVTFGREPGRVASTAADGSFSFDIGSDFPRFRLEASSEFGRTKSVRWDDPGSPDVAAGFTLVLEPAGRVEGTVRGPDGSVPRDGRVMVRAAGGHGYGPGWENYQARCDSNGRFEMWGVEPGKYEAVSWGDGLGLGFGPKLEVRAEETERLDLVLLADSWVSGTVVDEQGRG